MEDNEAKLKANNTNKEVVEIVPQLMILSSSSITNSENKLSLSNISRMNLQASIPFCSDRMSKTVKIPKKNKGKTESLKQLKE